jgi:NAD(P)-dependent dehydrogenase (short-subunit alcohol dehydrogenase family)
MGASLEGKTILVTGSTDGVGRVVAHRLAEQGAHILIHGRDGQRGREVVDHIESAGRGSATFLAADFSSLAEVRRLVDVIGRECDRLDVLINNAGIGSGGSAATRETSQDGYELRFAVNYLAGFLLTRLLLPLVRLNKPARIVNVSALGQHPIIFFGHFQNEKPVMKSLVTGFLRDESGGADFNDGLTVFLSCRGVSYLDGLYVLHIWRRLRCRF